mgnify:CR=1 FL=1
MSYGSIPDDRIYRVFVNKEKDTIEVVCIGMDKLDVKVEGTYSDIDELPEWLQERLAVLMVSHPQPPTNKIGNFGRRIDENTFWVIHPNTN